MISHQISYLSDPARLNFIIIIIIVVFIIFIIIIMFIIIIVIIIIIIIIIRFLILVNLPDILVYVGVLTRTTTIRLTQVSSECINDDAGHDDHGVCSTTFFKSNQN